MSRYLGNNFWLMDDGMVFNTKTQWLMKPSSLPFRVDGGKMRKKLPFEDTSDFRQFKEGYKFIMVDFCESVKRHKKTLNVNFLKFSTFDQTWRKYDSIKEKNGWFQFDYKFIPGRAYQLMCEVNYEFPSNIKIIKFKELKHD